MVALPLRIERTFTGRARVRQGWFGRMVLMLEVCCRGFKPEVPPMPGMTPAQRKQWREEQRSDPASEWTEWRDATWEDMQGRRFVLGHIGHEPPRPIPAPAPSWPRPPDD